MAASNNFKHTLIIRSISGAGLVVVMLAMLLWGGLWWHVFSAFVALGSLWEFYKMSPETSAAGRVVGMAGAALILIVSRRFAQSELMAILALCCMLAYFIELARRQLSGQSNSIAAVGSIVTGLVYVVIPWYCMICMRALPDKLGLASVLSIFLCTWSCDVFAFLIGSRWGSVRVCPNISPNKSLEGFIGGMLASVLCGGLCAFFFRFMPVAFILVGVACGTLGQLGDLIESLIKRENGVKDSGHILPGHGGFLDRFDSVLVNALCAWIIWCWCLIK